MNWEQIKTIIIAFLTSSVGATLIGWIAKVIADAVKSKITANATKLTDADFKKLAETVKTELTGKISIDLKDELDKATRNLLTEMRTKLNEELTQDNEIKRIVVASAKVMSQFKTVQGTTALDELNAVIASVNDTTIGGVASDEVEYVLVTPTETKTTTGKVSY